MSGTPVTRTVVATGSCGQAIDAMAPYGAKVTSVGIEREGLRDNWLAAAVGMVDPVTSETSAGT